MAGEPSDLAASSGFFDLAYRTGDVIAFAVPFRESVARTLEFLFHEAFHRTEAELETIEGSAQYVGLVARRIATGTDSPSPVEEAVTSLRSPLRADRRESMGGRLRWMHRGRLYGTGVALAILLNRLGVAWRAGLEGGGMLADLMRIAVHYQAGCCGHLVAAVLEAYEYGAVRARVERTLGSSG